MFQSILQSINSPHQILFQFLDRRFLPLKRFPYIVQMAFQRSKSHLEVLLQFLQPLDFFDSFGFGLQDCRLHLLESLDEVLL